MSCRDIDQYSNVSEDLVKKCSGSGRKLVIISLILIPIITASLILGLYFYYKRKYPPKEKKDPYDFSHEEDIWLAPAATVFTLGSIVFILVAVLGFGFSLYPSWKRTQSRIKDCMDSTGGTYKKCAYDVRQARLISRNRW